MMCVIEPRLGEQALPKATGASRLIRQLRKRLGLTQEQFASRAGVTFPTVNRWENGKSTPSPLALQRIQELLHAMGDKGADLLKRYFPPNAIGVTTGARHQRR